MIDSAKRHPLVGGAVVLVDEQLNLTSLRMYNEVDDRKKQLVKVETATLPIDGPNAFHDRIAGLIDPNQDPWKTFSQVAEDEIPRRVKNLKAKIADAD